MLDCKTLDAIYGDFLLDLERYGQGEKQTIEAIWSKSAALAEFGGPDGDLSNLSRDFADWIESLNDRNIPSLFWQISLFKTCAIKAYANIIVSAELQHLKQVPTFGMF